MALLQIAEPGQTAAPHQACLAVGIDLGQRIHWSQQCKVARRPCY